MQKPHDLLDLPEDASRDAIVQTYHDLLLRHPQELEPERFAEVERAYHHLTTLEQCMRDAMAYPEDTLRVLFTPPAMVRSMGAEPTPPPPLRLRDLEVLLGPWRRQLLEETLRY